MDYLRVSQVAEKWGLSSRRVRVLCAEGKIEGVIRKGKLYMIPVQAAKPLDGRSLKGIDFSDELIRLFLSIDAKKAALNKRRPFTKGELERINEEFLIEFTHNSNAIEGNTLTLKETALVLQGLTIDQKPLKDHLEAIGHRDAFYYVQNIAEKKAALSEQVIKNIHALVLIDRPQDRGIYRRIPVTIMGALHQPPQPYLIDPQMYALLQKNEQNKKSMHPLERIARFHLDFEGIHPFIDGNGRTGRLILNLDLIQNGFPPINIKFAARTKYYDAFDAYFGGGDARKMTGLLAGYVEDRLEQYLDWLG